MMLEDNLEELSIGHGTNLFAVIVSVLAWVNLYIVLVAVNFRHSYEWNCRTVTTVHAVLTVTLAGWSAFIQGPWPFTHPGGPNTLLQHVTVIISMGYFLFDLAWCLYFQTEGPVMVLHHVLSVTGMALTIFKGKYGTEMMATIFGTELTNPFLQTRWFLREMGKHETLMAVVNDVTFMLLFGILRIGVASCLLYTYLCHPRPDYLGKIGGCCIYLIGWAFWIMIVRYAIRKYTKGSGKKKNGYLSEANGNILKEKTS